MADTLTRFDTTDEWKTYLLGYAERVRDMIKMGVTQGLAEAVDDLYQLIEDLRAGFIVDGWCDEDVTGIQKIIAAAQARMYG